jgi:hypothetical protein
MGNNSSQNDESKLLSIVITGRDDDYMPDFLYRITTTLNFIARNLSLLNRLHDVEIVIVDWGSRKPMSETLNLSPQAAQICRFLYVPLELIKEIQNGKENFHPSISVNVGIRKSSGNFIMLSAADTLFTKFSLDSLLQLLDGTHQLPVDIHRTYFICSRHNVPWQFVKRQPSLDEWEYFLLTTAGEYIGNEGALYSISSSAGSLMMNKLLWHEMSGLDEKCNGWGFNDIDLSLRMSQNYTWLELTCIGVSSYHMAHDPYDRRPAKKQIFNPHYYNKDIRVNEDTWGLNSYALKLTTLCSPEKYARSENISGIQNNIFSGKNSQELQSEIQNVKFLKIVLKNIHIFDYAWNLHLPLRDVQALVFLTWYCLLYYPRRYVQYGITQNNVANIFAVAQFSPNIEIYALHEWEGLDSEPTPERIATKLKRQTSHMGYVRFLNGNVRNALERLRVSFIGNYSFDLAFLQCEMNTDAAQEQLLKAMNYVSPGGAIILQCFDNVQLQYLLNEMKARYAQMTYVRCKKGKIGLILNAALSDKQQTGNDVPVEFAGAIDFVYLLKLNGKIYLKSMMKILRVLARPLLYQAYFKNLYKRISA